MTPIGRFLAALAATMPIAASDYRIEQPPLRLLPGLTPAGEQLAQPGDIVADGALGRPDELVLLAPLAVDKKQFADGAIFVAAGIDGLPGTPAPVFCEAEAGAKTKPAPRYCLFDQDQDGRLDRAIVAGTGTRTPPVAIRPTAFRRIGGIMLDGSRLALRYAGPAGERGSVSFDAELTIVGVPRLLAAPRHRVPITRLPAYGMIEGALITVLAVDPATKTARLRVDRDLSPGYFTVPPPPPTKR